jgi:hypothetical protein
MLVFLALWAVVVTIQHGSRAEVARIEAEKVRPLTPEETTTLTEKVKRREEAHWGSEDGRKEAFGMSKQFVTKRFKAPATADFPYYSNSEVKVQHRGKGVFLVKGYVDAQNAFGANLRTYYLCASRLATRKVVWVYVEVNSPDLVL